MDRAMNIAAGKRATKVRVAVGLLIVGAATFTSVRLYAAEEGAPYLALGDSVAFGFITQAGFEYLNADNFIGYPAYVGAALNMKTVRGRP